MKMTIRIDLDNAAFEQDSGCEVGRILRKLADRLDGFCLLEAVGGIPLYDINGNTVGKAVVE